ncbi:MAG: Fe-S cluster assembly protein SufD [Gammaproteobacteria bacterium]
MSLPTPSTALCTLREAHTAVRDTVATSHAVRQDDALARFEAADFPSLSHEDWRYTNLRPFKDAPLVPANQSTHAEETIGLAGWRLNVDPTRVVVPAGAPDGVTAISLREAIDSNHPLAAALGTAHVDEDIALRDLNDAFAADALLINIADNADIDTPILIDWQLAAGEHALSSPRLLITAGRNSRATIIERRVGRGGYSNAVSEVVVNDGANLRYVDVSRESAPSHLLARLDALVARDAQFDAFSLALGGTLTRNDLHVRLNAPGAGTSLCGSFVAGAGNHIDNHTVIDHVSERTTSNENYRGIIGRAGHGVFNGKVIVRKDAQRINSAMNNDNLLLDDSAEIDTKPELQIYADDVRCSHGATIGRLDEQALFYLRSRGLNTQTAKRLLLDAFAAEALVGVGGDLRDALVHSLTGFLSEQLGEHRS